MNEQSAGSTPKYLVADKHDTFRNCQICDELYRSGSYSEHQKEEKHNTMRRERRLAQNAQYQRNWRAKKRAEGHQG